MGRTVVLTILIVIGAAIGGYALWTATSTAGETVAESCSDAAATACASATDAGCAGCPSAMPAEQTPSASDATVAMTDAAGCEGDPSECTDEMKEACGAKCVTPAETEAEPACESAESASCGGGRCGMGSTTADAS